ncbi:MAG: 2-oxoacid:acceptor oxidoreductase subunit alpha [Candidatus Pacebacteria bacterium]|jgi:2-oxoglutarate ferredoxin oxidoreductase subunit alpha|nr:2-oxoacid:acceptor oxidoreductase subunit alpha [Candidatus Paceibacterota bacterium]MDD5012788.1 2-oxoacid:acceptor oxidoreductase subunit alpha [Candidatus Paceibacterota bacterium]MDD5752528.1 2-oxoacid:acceptor oxidoreductase subunit alpha [Candidatus Paceibacterota bacterium]
MNKKDFSILIGGAAGQGSRKAGLIIAKIFSSLGYKIYIYDDYQSLIRGGHSFSLIRASEKENNCSKKKIDILLALDEKTIQEHLKDLNEDGLIIFNQDKVKEEKGIGIAIESTVKELGGIPIMANTALLGGFAKIIGLDFDFLKNILEKEISKGIEKNLEIAKKAYDLEEAKLKIEDIGDSTPLLTGNEALSLGVVAAGLEMYIAYPMTPATGILHYLAGLKDCNVLVSQLENEIAVINAAIGAAYTGKRTMVGTSGGGFALMTEAISLAAMSETPIVIVNSQRPGPATGVPTYSGQGDLLFTLNSGHGDLVRFVIAPGDVNEMFVWSGKAMNLAWKYQTPVILLTEKDLSEATFSFDKKVLSEVKKEEALMWDKNKEYQRYELTENGISPLFFPGNDAIVKSTSYEHDEYGISTEDEEMIKKMQDKRLRKFESMKKEIDNIEAINVYGDNSETAVVCVGSLKGIVKSVCEKLGIKMIQPIVLEPFPQKQALEALKGVNKVICIEANALGQLSKVLAQNNIKVYKSILKYDGRPFNEEDLKDQLKNI